MSAVANNEKENNDTANVNKFTKMVAMSQKLYTSKLFKNKQDRTRRRKLVTQLRGLYATANDTKHSFEDAVIKSGWKEFKQWLDETNCIELESESDQIKLIQTLNKKKEINWKFIKGPDLKEDACKELVGLTCDLMKDFYDNSKNLGPWNDDKMAEEIKDKNSQCLIIRNQASNELIGYISFRIEPNVVDLETDYLECYVYELMIAEKYQRKGYGVFLMEVCEFIAESKECDYIELTVFTENIAAIKFYRKQLKYNFDKNELDEYKTDYRILTKIL